MMRADLKKYYNYFKQDGSIDGRRFQRSAKSGMQARANQKSAHRHATRHTKGDRKDGFKGGLKCDFEEGPKDNLEMDSRDGFAKDDIEEGFKGNFESDTHYKRVRGGRHCNRC